MPFTDRSVTGCASSGRPLFAIAPSYFVCGRMLPPTVPPVDVAVYTLSCTMNCPVCSRSPPTLGAGSPVFLFLF